jgi:hypothetical protein
LSSSSSSSSTDGGGDKKKSFDKYLDKTTITTQLWQQRDGSGAVEHADGRDEKDASPWVPKTKKSSESALSIRYNFQTDRKLRDSYVGYSGKMQSGKLMEDLDAFAG